MRSLLVLVSYHHKNTEKVANIFAKVLEAPIKAPQQINPEELQEYSLIGFGSGIYDEKHHKGLLGLADNLPPVSNRKAFIFSTSGVTREAAKKHSLLREKLQSKGYLIVDEFNCAGFNTNSFLKLFGGMNKGRPNAEDLKHAEEFAQNLKQNLELNLLKNRQTKNMPSSRRKQVEQNRSD
ncbi:MAG: flavodoxin family protein [Candidatus Hodarchaeales archaeon]|jgi:flavodoxin